jgi:hypothetical protein
VDQFLDSVAGDPCVGSHIEEHDQLLEPVQGQFRMPLDFSLEEFAVGVHVDVAGFAEFEDEQHEGDEAGEDE